MESNNASSSRRPSRLINHNARFEAPNDLVDKLELQFNILQEKLDGKTEKEVNEILITSSKDPSFNDIASGGFLYGILVDIPNAQRHFANFYHYCLSVADGWYQALLKMNMILLEIFYKLKAQPRQQILYFFSESIKHNIPKIDNVLMNLFRTVSDGTDYKETCVILQGIADILNNNKEWIKNLKPNGALAPVVLLCLSRFISDQHQSGSSNCGNNNGCGDLKFKNAMIVLCDFLLKERFSDMIPLGRDLVLILMRLSKVAPFMQYWKLLLYNPGALLPKFTGIAQLMNTPCHLLGYRVSLHVGRKIEYILKMRSLPQKNLDWFVKAHLSGPDNGSLRAEIIRYVWNNIQQPEYQQPSAIEVRAQFLAWLLKGARPGVEAQWCKLMIFWDWYGFDPQIPNSIQNVEPGFSLVRFLASTAPSFANSLLDYLIRTSTILHPPLTAYFISCITAAFKSLSHAGMPVQSVLESNRLDKPVRDALRETFPEVFSKKTVANAVASAQQSSAVTSLNNDLKEPGAIIDFDAVRSHQVQPNTSTSNSITETNNINSSKFEASNSHHHHRSSSTMTSSNSGSSSATDGSNISSAARAESATAEASAATLSKRECNEKNSSSHRKDSVSGSRLSSSSTKKKLKKKHSSSESDDQSVTNVATSAAEFTVIHEYEENNKSLSVFLPMVKEEFREHLEALSTALKEEANERASESMQSLLLSVFEDDDGLDEEQSELIAECLLRIFGNYLKKQRFLPPADEFNADMPLYALYRNLSETTENDSTRRQLQMILSDMRDKCGSIGFLFLYFAKAARRDSADYSASVSAYVEFCRYLDKSVESQLVDDMQQCSIQDNELFAFLLPFIFDKMAYDTIGSVDLMHLVCSTVDSKQLADLIGEIIRENITLFRKDSFLNLMASSLNWETVEQMILWHLIRAAGVQVEWVIGIIPRLQHNRHSEAMTNILLLLKNMDHEPSMLLLRSILSRTPNDLFAVHALKVLIDDDDDNLARVANLINTLVKKLIAANEIVQNNSDGASSSQSGKSKLKKTVTVHNVFAHLDKFRQNCLTKDSHRAEALLSTESLQEIFMISRRDAKLMELRSQFSELFAVMEIFSEETNASSRSQRKNRTRINDEVHVPNDLRNKRRRVKEENSDDEDR